jgi:hypothetical protein
MKNNGKAAAPVDVGGDWYEENRKLLEAASRARAQLTLLEERAAEARAALETARAAYRDAVQKIQENLGTRKAKNSTAKGGGSDWKPSSAIQLRLLRVLDDLGTASAEDIAGELGSEQKGTGISLSLAALAKHGCVEQLANKSWALSESRQSAMRAEKAA